MMKLRSLSAAALSTAAAALLLGPASAQRQPMPGMPVVSVSHPGLLVQPLADQNQAAAAACAAMSAPPTRVDPATHGVKASGTQLRKAVARVRALPWNRTLASAKREAAESGRPILWLQTLGDLSGFA